MVQSVALNGDHYTHYDKQPFQVRYALVMSASDLLAVLACFAVRRVPLYFPFLLWILAMDATLLHSVLMPLAPTALMSPSKGMYAQRLVVFCVYS